MPNRRQFLGAVAGTAGVLSGCTGGQNGDTPEGTQEPTSTPEPTEKPNRELREQILQTYSDGMDQVDSAVATMQEANDAYDTESYQTAESKAESAGYEFADASETFRDAADLAARLDGYDDAGETCDTAIEFAVLYRDAAYAGRDLAQAYQDGDQEEAERQADKMSELDSEARSLSVRSVETLEAQLDLD
jgi:hypothetical protein